ncbi:hypothetical protein IIC65_03330 [Candidatus Sumerlaeota bacterium]|nr:hypothetical protein [Candidatus Sumerlaeota bacterium]
MKRAGRLGVVLIVLLLIAGALWWAGIRYLASFSAEPSPAPFLPPSISLALRVSDFEGALERHWATRGRDGGTDAIEHVLRAMGTWETWEEQYGQTGARARIAAYQKAIFQLLGSEAWIVFGQWPQPPGIFAASENPASPADSPPGDGGEVAFLVFAREDSMLKSRIGLLADLILPENRLRTTQYRGHEIFEYLDAENRRQVSWTHLRGWICASMRNPGRSAVERMIDQLEATAESTREATAASGNHSANPFGTNDATAERPAFSGVLRPGMIAEHLRLFSLQSGQFLSQVSEARIVSWALNMEGIEEIRLDQSGDSFLNLDLSFSGPRIQALESFLTEPDPAMIETIQLPASSELSPSILQADFSYPFAVGGLRLLGIDWESVIDVLDDLRWVAPTLGETLRELLLVDVAPRDGRVGLALYPTTRFPIPIASVWEDRLPLMRSASSPADAWRLIDSETIRSRGDFILPAINAVYDRPTADSLSMTKRSLVDRLWARPGTLPLAFLSIHFDNLVDWMDSFPTILLSRDDRPAWNTIRSLARGLHEALGSMVLRVDRRGPELLLTLRALEL